MKPKIDPFNPDAVRAFVRRQPTRRARRRAWDRVLNLTEQQIWDDSKHSNRAPDPETQRIHEDFMQWVHKARCNGWTLKALNSLGGDFGKLRDLQRDYRAWLRRRATVPAIHRAPLRLCVKFPTP